VSEQRKRGRERVKAGEWERGGGRRRQRERAGGGGREGGRERRRNRKSTSERVSGSESETGRKRGRMTRGGARRMRGREGGREGGGREGGGQREEEEGGGECALLSSRNVLETSDRVMHISTGFCPSASVWIRPTQSTIYVPLQLNRFQKKKILIVQYKYLKSCSEDFNLQNLILRTRLCGTGFITQPS